jgi:hypothetical protein
MHTGPAHARTSIRRLAWLAALLVVLRVFAIELHDAVADHPIGESCVACVVAERGGEALAAGGAEVALPRPSALAPRLSPGLAGATVVLRPPARAPPLFPC